MSFVPNPAFEAELLRSPEMVHALGTIAEKKAEKARATAPVGSGDDPHPGQFRDSIGWDAGYEDGVAIGRVFSDDPDFIYIEFGTEDTPRFATLRNCLESGEE